MRPSQTSAALRRIASAIDKSRRPDRRLVAKDLRRVLASMGGYKGLVPDPSIAVMDLINDNSLDQWLQRAAQSVLGVEGQDPKLLGWDFVGGQPDLISISISSWGKEQKVQVDTTMTLGDLAGMLDDAWNWDTADLQDR